MFVFRWLNMLSFRYVGKEKSKYSIIQYFIDQQTQSAQSVRQTEK